MASPGSKLILHDRELANARLMRGFYIKTGAKVIAVAVVVFLLTRLWGPALINRHQDVALAGGIACYVAALAAIVWLTAQIGADRARLAIDKSRLRDTPP